ncbi:MAG: hypothetical protein HYV29_00945 [Ignavibacteriales bacterium]|nr:hypothetical protein [Ignavibacteriales bacterium]
MNNSFDLQQIATSEIAPEGESLLWCGQPDPIRLAMTTLPVFIFAIPWTAFSVFWIYGASGFQFPPDFSQGGFSYFPLFGVPFLLIGLGMLSAPVFTYTKAFRTVYIISNKSIRIVTTGRTKKVESYTAKDIGKIERKEKPDGNGDIIFRTEITLDSRNRQKTTPVGFYGIRDVRTVEQHINNLKRSLESGDHHA